MATPIFCNTAISPSAGGSSFLGHSLSPPSSVTIKQLPTRVALTRAGNANPWQELLGGRGLPGGEEALKLAEKKEQIPPTIAPSEPAVDSPPVETNVTPDGFNKELMGLTGGFPGGEKGLARFIYENPPPPKAGDVLGILRAQLPLLNAKPRPPPQRLPLLMPGMIVIVKNPKSLYHMFTGIVQRVTDGRAGVLFEGGNWDKLVTFELQDLERRSQGPPMLNPKSAILE